jgi:hypothetical protein
VGAQHVGAGSETMQSVGEGVLYYGGVAGGGVSASNFITEVKDQASLTDFLDSCAMPQVNPAVSRPALPHPPEDPSERAIPSKRHHQRAQAWPHPPTLFHTHASPPHSPTTQTVRRRETNQ